MDIAELNAQGILYHLQETSNIIRQLLPIIKKHKVLALHGELGAGKTTFTAALCRLLKTKEIADSPTFSLINQYSFVDEAGKEQFIFHTDWYRIKDEEEARMAGIEDMIQGDYFLCIVEWSENAPELLPENTLHLYFALGEQPDTRIIAT